MLWQILLHGKAPVYNVGGVERASVATLAGDIGNITNAVVFPTPKVGSELAGSAKNPILSVSRIDEEFGDLDYLSLSGGLRRTIEWQKGLYQ
jgi:nucleoside-diphosphate-sugar epimerase